MGTFWTAVLALACMGGIVGVVVYHMHMAIKEAGGLN
jgi:amino acid transporter